MSRIDSIEKQKLLIVEDDPGLQRQLRWAYEDYATLIAGSREEALTLLRATLERGDGKPIEQRRADALEKFAGISVNEARLTARVGKPMGQWGPRDIAELVKAYTSITVDGIPVEEFFPEEVVTVAELTV